MSRPVRSEELPPPPPTASVVPREDTIKQLGQELRTSKPADKLKALNHLAGYGTEANTVGEELIEAMADPTPEVRDLASEVFEKVNPKVHQHVFTVLRGMNKPGALLALGELRTDAKVAVPLILNCQETQGASFIFPILAKISPQDKRFAASVLSLVSNPPPEVIRKAGTAYTSGRAALDFHAGLEHLSVIEASTSDKVSALVKGLQKTEGRTDEIYRTTSDTHLLIAQLQKYKGDAKQALPLLKKLKLSRNDQVRQAATKAIKEIE
ncbi:hypothetical protein R5W23_000131 [Gemmata sp. JC673]|uniref:HEAT repeat domain-containing protein n=1 Tax=Gemmata algarum TaxID=2975278 RepID=A0ABU5EQR8_9BACT|nr:hypothetical protein [Gemmata algarum]MDY3557604.1 hypothetical protein [Gemmata algarum]